MRTNSPLGLFAYVYRRTTEAIRDEVQAGTFEDNERMEAMDVIFANLYIRSYYRYGTGEPIRESWRVAFAAAEEKHIALQHILLGMNAHINIDLAEAASSVMKGKPITALEADFRHVNEILASITDELQSRLGRVSPLMFILDWLGVRSDEKMIDFSITLARSFSWDLARRIHSQDSRTSDETLEGADIMVSAIGNRIRNPRWKISRYAMRMIRIFEAGNISAIIEAMRS